MTMILFCFLFLCVLDDHDFNTQGKRQNSQGGDEFLSAFSVLRGPQGLSCSSGTILLV